MKPIRTMLLLLSLLSGGAPAVEENVPRSSIEEVAEAKRIQSLLRQPENEMDFAVLKLNFDKMLDPGVDVAGSLKRIEQIVVIVRAMAGNGASANTRLQALKTYLYIPGDWNGDQSYRYDLDDPLGRKFGNKLLSTYLESRKGNCVTMPVLFAVLAQRLGLDVSLTTAPEHILVKYTDPLTGQTVNLETTSGANPARDVWIRQQTEIRDEAIENGIYLQKLSKRESAAVMASIVAEYFSAKRQPERMLAISDVLLAAYPRDIASMLRKGSAHVALIKREFAAKYPTPAQIPAEEQGYYRYLVEQNRYWYARAESLGWREPSAASRAQYRQTVERAKAN